MADSRMGVPELRRHLENLAASRGTRWEERLAERKKAEIAFHDDHRSRAEIPEATRHGFQSDLSFTNRFYTFNDLSIAYVRQWLEAYSRGKVVLDYACGIGADAIRAAKAGAQLGIGIDLSANAIRNAKADARTEGVEASTYFLQGDCEDTNLPDSCIDTVTCAGVLHHMDLSYAFPELRRILVPGGRILAYEALDHNLLFRLYRRMTPNLRTAWEKDHIVRTEDLSFAGRFFDIGDVRYWHMSSVLSRFAPPLYPLFNLIDLVLTRTPVVQRLSWMITFELVKRS
jgi:ubiquinone/menaquinone biosynthesis C-methylase UbiE